jgi:AbrB family looped-hinge helix DNA binding protein
VQNNLLIKTTVKVAKGGKIFIPAAIREKTGIKEGMELDIRLLKTDVGWLITLQEAKSG